jgi:anti-anti-sigma regulatory factor
MQSSRSVAAAETVLDSMGLRLTAHRCGRCQVVNVCGNVGADTAGLLDTGLRAALDGELLLIAANLHGAVLADASALEVLIGIHRRAILTGKVFLVVAPDHQTRETMRATGLDQTLLVFPTVADFNAWNGAPGPQQMVGTSLYAREPQQVRQPGRRCARLARGGKHHAVKGDIGPARDTDGRRHDSGQRVRHLKCGTWTGSQAGAQAELAHVHSQSPQGSGGVIVPGHHWPPSDGIHSIMHPVTVRSQEVADLGERTFRARSQPSPARACPRGRPRAGLRPRPPTDAS